MDMHLSGVGHPESLNIMKFTIYLDNSVDIRLVYLRNSAINCDTIESSFEKYTLLLFQNLFYHIMKC